MNLVGFSEMEDRVARPQRGTREATRVRLVQAAIDLIRQGGMGAVSSEFILASVLAGGEALLAGRVVDAHVVAEELFLLNRSDFCCDIEVEVCKGKSQEKWSSNF